MKKSIIYSLVALVLLASCRKSDNPRLPDLTAVPLPTIKLSTTSSNIIPGVNQDAYSATFTVSLYFPTGTPPSKFDIVVEKNGDPTKVKTIQANVTTFPSTVTVTGLQLRTLFGATIAGGDDYTIGADVTTQNGDKYLAFPPVGTAYGSGINAQPGASPTIDLNALAPFVATAYGAIGVPTPYKVLKDEWQDYNVGQVIPVTVIDATHLSFMYAANAAQPIVIAVDLATNTTSVASVVYGNYGAPFGNFSAVSVPSADNVVFPLKLTVSVRLHHTESKGGDFGNATIQLQKQ